MVSHGVSSLFGSIALILSVAACAGPMTQAGSAELPGKWHGSFVHPGAESTGTIAAQGNRVVLNDSSGTQITFSRSGDTLYGVMKDTATGRAAMMSLAKEEPSARQVAETTSARLCQAAGGMYSRGTCQPALDQTVVARQCEERGGVYFAADYCEVPAGGLRPR